MDGISSHKFPDLIKSSSSADYHVIAIGETWLEESVKNEILDKQYNIYRKDRYMSSISKTASHGGGVLIAVRSNIICGIYNNDKMSNLEAICIRIHTKENHIYVYCTYIQPTASREIYAAHLDAIKLLMTEINKNDTVIIVGDFNFGNSITWRENDSGYDYLPLIGESQSSKSIIAREITSGLIDCGLSQISNFVNKCGNLLETVFTNVPELAVVNKADFLLLPSAKSDDYHVPIMCTVECTPEILPSDDPSTVYCFKRANYDLIREYLSEINFFAIFNNMVDVNDMVSHLYSVIYDTFEQFVPRSSIRKSNKPIWFDKKLAHLKNIRNKHYKALCNERKGAPNSQPSIIEFDFMTSKSEYESHRNNRFSEFLRDQASNAKNNPKLFWRHINSKRTNNSIPANMKYGDKSASTDIEKAELFAEFFQSVYTKHSIDNELPSFIENRQDHNCFNLRVTAESVLGVLSRMNLSKGSGFDGVSSLFLRECAEILTIPLYTIYSRSLRDCVYPDLFKIGQITPIFKAGNRNNIENYRGVSVLPNLAKVFERLIYNQLKLIIPPQISPNQHGFLSNRNIETNLMELTTLIHRAFNLKCQLDVFYADIKKAFDCVNPYLLIRTLSRYKISNNVLRFFISYFESRTQYVKCNGSLSKFFDVSSGVGQGSILGPLLFIAFFNGSDFIHDVSDVLSLNFADDKKLAVIIKDHTDTVKLQQAINRFMTWLKDNGLSVNESKCRIISFSLKRSPIINNYTLNNKSIERVYSIRDLGVILDSKLAFNEHREFIQNKAKAALHFVQRQSHYFQNDIIKMLYTSLVRSNLEFASSIWMPHHIANISPIESVQKQMVIFLNGDHIDRCQNNYILRPYIDRCKDVGFITLRRRHVNAAALFIHAIISGRFSSRNLRSQMELNTGIRTLRNPEFIKLKIARTDTSTYSSFNNACRIFNHAALFIDPSLSQYEFRNKLLTLPDTAFGDWVKIK